LNFGFAIFQNNRIAWAYFYACATAHTKIGINGGEIGFWGISIRKLLLIKAVYPILPYQWNIAIGASQRNAGDTALMTYRIVALRANTKARL